MKKILLAIGILSSIAVAAVFFLLSNLDGIVKNKLENIGSELLGVPVNVATVEIKLKDGSGRISGLTIANPAGFSKEKAFEMDTIKLDINLHSLKQQPLIIPELSIIRPVARLEVKENGMSNLQTLLDNIHKNSAQTDKKAAEEQDDPAVTTAGEPRKIAFGKLNIIGVTVHADLAGQPPKTVVIPDFSRKAVGKEKGLTPGEIGGVILGDIITRAIEAALMKSLTDKVEETAMDLFDKLRSKLDEHKKE